jgi:hypothetical protein
MRRGRRRRTATLSMIGVTAALALGGCGGSFDSKASGEHLIKDYVKKRGNGTVTLTSVKCPSGVKEKAGTSYDCNVTMRVTPQGTNSTANFVGTITVHIDSGNKVAIHGRSDVHLHQ